MGDTSANVVTEDLELERKPFFVPRPNPSAIPAVGIFEEPLVCLMINQKWAAHFRGVIEALDQRDTWIGTDEEIEAARQQIREALVQFGNECMICCDETNALLQIMVDNQTTIINQGNQTTVNQYQQEFQNFITNNNNTQFLNQMLYDDTPQSIYPDAGENFNSTGDERLCAAIDTYINAQIYTHGQESNNLQFAASSAAGAFIAVAALLSVISGGVSIAIGVAVGAAIFASLEYWESILNDQAAQRKVKCCMYDSLLDQPLTRENFQTSVDDCGFDSGSNEQRLAQQIANDNNYYEENWLAFLRAMAQAPVTSTEACMCDCADDIVIEDYYGSGCVITPMGNCIYRFVQSTPDETGKYFFSLRDIGLQCLRVELSPDPLMPTAGVGTNTNIVDCTGTPVPEFVGGFTDPSGSLQSARWWSGGPGSDHTYLKITLAP